MTDTFQAWQLGSASWAAQLAVADMRLTAMEQQRDSARRIARALYALLDTNDLASEQRRALGVLAEEARREKEINKWCLG